MTDKEDADQLLDTIIENKTVNAEQVKALDAYIHADWVVDHEEAEHLFRVNHALADNVEACPEWCDFFRNAVVRLLVMDMETPGEIDQQEGDWLGSLVEKYRVGNVSEHMLFSEIQKMTSKIEGAAASFLSPEL